MVILYYPPHRAPDDAELEYECNVALRDYLEDLAEFPAEILRGGWREARRTHKTQAWPTIAAIRNACLALAPRAQHAHTLGSDPRCMADNRMQKAEMAAPQHTVMADSWMQTQDGQRMLENGNGYDGWLHVARLGRPPHGPEIDRMMAARERALTGLATLDEAHPLRRFYLARDKSEARLAERFLRRGAA